MKKTPKIKVNTNVTIELVAKYLLDLHIKEHLFGNTETKQTVLNVLKLFDKVEKITIHHITAVFVDFPLENFSEVRYCLELLEVFTKNVELTSE